MKLGFAISVVGSAVDSAAGMSTFGRELERSAGCNMDEAIVDALAVRPTLDQMLGFASQVIARRSDHGKA